MDHGETFVAKAGNSPCCDTCRNRFEQRIDVVDPQSGVTKQEYQTDDPGERVAEQVREGVDSLVCKQMIAVHVDPNVVETLTKEILRLESENKALIDQQIQPFTVDEVKAIIAENDYLRERLNEMEE